jgi:hypothetical protein
MHEWPDGAEASVAGLRARIMTLSVPASGVRRDFKGLRARSAEIRVGRVERRVRGAEGSGESELEGMEEEEERGYN